MYQICYTLCGCKDTKKFSHLQIKSKHKQLFVTFGTVFVALKQKITANRWKIAQQ